MRCNPVSVRSPLFGLLLVAAACGPCWTQNTRLPSTSPIDCSKFGSANGCKTFNEMVVARDKDTTAPALVCSVTGSDTSGIDEKGKTQVFYDSSEDTVYLYPTHKLEGPAPEPRLETSNRFREFA